VLGHYLVFAVRQLRSQRVYSVITIGGFALGLAGAILLALFLRHELSYDRWLPAGDRTFRVHIGVNIPGRDPFRAVMTQGALTGVLATDVPEVEAVTRLYPDQLTIREGAGVVRVDVMFADPNVLDLLPLPVLAGDPTAALADASSAVLTETAARHHFGTTAAIGQTLTLCCFENQPRPFRVAAILRDLPETTHLALGVVLGIGAIDAGRRGDLAQWHNVAVYSYVRLRPGASASAAAARLPAVLERHVPPLSFGSGSMSVGDLFSLSLLRVPDIHLHARRDADAIDDMRPLGDIAAVRALAAVAGLLLLIAVSNFLNLATARAQRRAREIAVRRVHGAGRADIVVQYLGEAVLVAIVALVLGLALVEVTLPWFEDLVGRALPPPHDPALLITATLGAIGLGLVSGLYPAIGLARLDPSSVMRTHQGSIASGSGRLRQVLVFTQFAIAIGLAIGTVVVHAQTRHAATVDLGFDRRDMLVVKTWDDRLVGVREQLADRVRRMPGVVAVTMGNYLPGAAGDSNTLIERPGDPAGQPILIGSLGVDYDYFTTLGVAPLAGRLLSREFPGDDMTPGVGPADREYSIIANVAALRRLGLGSPEQAVGQVLRGLQNVEEPDRTVPMRIVGVVPDVHFHSAHSAVPPTLFARDGQSLRRMGIRFAPGRRAEVTAAVRAAWIEVAPEVPFAVDLLEDQLDAQYRDEQRLADTLAGSALLALLVACLGLYGLSSYVTESRRREIAIRKVMGAGTGDVLVLLGWQLARPILLACLVAVPASYLLAGRWLGGFAYRIELGAGFFAMAIAGAVLIAAATVAVQTVRAARTRPIAALRAE
jgi:putative ABC transport system permease protein